MNVMWLKIAIRKEPVALTGIAYVTLVILAQIVNFHVWIRKIAVAMENVLLDQTETQHLANAIATIMVKIVASIILRVQVQIIVNMILVVLGRINVHVKLQLRLKRNIMGNNAIYKKQIVLRQIVMGVGVAYLTNPP